MTRTPADVADVTARLTVQKPVCRQSSRLAVVVGPGAHKQQAAVALAKDS